MTRSTRDAFEKIYGLMVGAGWDREPEPLAPSSIPALRALIVNSPGFRRAVKRVRVQIQGTKPSEQNEAKDSPVVPVLSRPRADR